MNKSSTARGFTFLELVVTVAIIGILSWLAVANLWRLKPRADLAGTTAELAALLHQARQTALGDGKPVAVLFYPAVAQKVGASQKTQGFISNGYVLVYEDACFDFFTATPACGVAFRNYDPAKPALGGNSKVVDTLTLPMNVVFGPDTEMVSSTPLPAPLGTVPVNVSCSFCGTTAGAVQFDPQGRVSFYKLDGTTQTALSGTQSVSLGFNQATARIPGHRTLVIFSGSGMVQIIVRG